MDPRDGNSYSPATSDPVDSKAPENSSSLIDNQSKVTPLITTLNQMCSVKLDRRNYLLWHSMVLPLIKGNRLDGYISGAKPCPEQYISGGAERRLNPAYEDWVTIDQLLLGWLYNTMTVDVASQVLGCSTSQELWRAVKEFSEAQTKSRMTQYKSELQRLRKGSMKMDEYLNKIKNISDNLFLAGSPVPVDDLITQALAGLDSEYNPVVVQLADKEDLSWVELQAALLTFESRLEQLSSLSSLSLSQPSASAATSRNINRASNQVEPNRRWRSQNMRGRGNRGRGGRFTRGGNRPTCQLCSKIGHTAMNCYFRFD